MANNSFVYQQATKVSIPRSMLVEIAQGELSKNELKVFLVLLSELDGWARTSDNSVDPENFKKIDIEQISNTLDLSESKVQKCVVSLRERGIIEKGRNNVVSKGYRFTF